MKGTCRQCGIEFEKEEKQYDDSEKRDETIFL
jgi:hypothetical protein